MEYLGLLTNKLKKKKQYKNKTPPHLNILPHSNKSLVMNQQSGDWYLRASVF